jgi:hypothetical protein
MGRDGAFITGSDFLIDGGVTASASTGYSPRNDQSSMQPEKEQQP